MMIGVTSPEALLITIKKRPMNNNFFLGQIMVLNACPKVTLLLLILIFDYLSNVLLKAFH
jgi:hypothetical protein